MNRATYLIVDQQQPPPEKLTGLLKELAQNHQLDSYQCRQRLIGRGLSLLTKGSAEKLREISTSLKQAGFTHWLVEPSKPEFFPPRLRALQLSRDEIVFTCQKNPVVFPRGANILAVLAEMSGELVEKNIKQLLSSNAYRGRDHIRPLEQQKIQRIILQGQPILDLYRLDEQKRIVAAVRVFPGKFNPEGLGERATLSSRQNLDRVLNLVQEYAGHCTLVTDFGLVNLPGCALRRGNPDDLEIQRHNQLSLARYGWLLADLERVGSIRPSVTENTAELTAVTTAALLQTPLTATGRSNDILPLTEKLGAELNKAAPSNNKVQNPESDTIEDGLPAPPAARRTYRWNRPSFWIGSAGALVFAGVTLLLEIDGSRVIGTVGYHAFASGAIFFLPAVLL
ncbi:MAG: hypothetical protein GXP51_05050, partial [Deltaproteobacteria bacterium]|nr:hypothetical protein [Deltaproteobacteria bacterium]